PPAGGRPTHARRPAVEARDASAAPADRRPGTAAHLHAHPRRGRTAPSPARGEAGRGAVVRGGGSDDPPGARGRRGRPPHTPPGGTGPPPGGELPGPRPPRLGPRAGRH